MSNSEILPFTGVDGLSSYYGKGFQTRTTNVLNVDLALNQKLEDLLQLALLTPEEIRVQTEELNVGFHTENRTWELIVKYHGSLDMLEALGVDVEYLIAGYAVLTVPEQLVDRVAELEEIEYDGKAETVFL